MRINSAMIKRLAPAALLLGAACVRREPSAPAAPAPVAAPVSSAQPPGSAAATPAALPAEAYAARIEVLGQIPRTAAPGGLLTIKVKVTNASAVPFPAAADGADPRGTVLLAYHLLRSASDEAVVYDGLRTALERPLAAGESRVVAMKLEMPRQPGEYRIAIDLVHEGVTWFAEQGKTKGPVVRVSVRG